MYAVVQIGSTIFRSECLTTRSVVCADAGAASASGDGDEREGTKRAAQEHEDLQCERHARSARAMTARSAHAAASGNRACTRRATGISDASLRIDRREPRHARLDRLGRVQHQVLAKARPDDLHADRQSVGDARWAPPSPAGPAPGTAISVAHSRQTCSVRAALSTSKPCAYGGSRAHGRQHERRAREEQVPFADRRACARRAPAGARRASVSGTLSST